MILTGVYSDTRRRTEGGRWVAVWKIETTRGPQFQHVPVDGFGLTREAAEFQAVSNPPQRSKS